MMAKAERAQWSILVIVGMLVIAIVVGVRWHTQAENDHNRQAVEQWEREDRDIQRKQAEGVKATQKSFDQAIEAMTGKPRADR